MEDHTAFVPVQRKLIVISDSMLRGINIGWEAEYVARGGAQVKDLTSAIRRGPDDVYFNPIWIDGYNLFLIHVGTIDISCGRSTMSIVLDMRELLEVICHRCPEALIVVSGILYRPFDDKDSFRKVNDTNYALFKLCNSFHNCLLVKSYAVVKAGRELVTRFFDHSGLHLNDLGREQLSHFLQGQLSVTNLRGVCNRFGKWVPRFLY